MKALVGAWWVDLVGYGSMVHTGMVTYQYQVGWLWFLTWLRLLMPVDADLQVWLSRVEDMLKMID